jgi:hypothetical protein
MIRTSLQNQWSFLHQWERNQTFWQGKEIGGVPEEAEKDENATDPEAVSRA